MNKTPKKLIEAQPMKDTNYPKIPIYTPTKDEMTVWDCIDSLMEMKEIPVCHLFEMAEKMRKITCDEIWNRGSAKKFIDDVQQGGYTTVVTWDDIEFLSGSAGIKTTDGKYWWIFKIG